MNVLEKLITLEHKATNFGFKWETSDQIIKQIKSEISEIEVHLKDGDRNKLQDEIGDLMHAVFSLCVFNQFDPQKTLANSVEKFELRFNEVERLTKKKRRNNLYGLPFHEVMKFWEEAKQNIIKKINSKLDMKDKFVTAGYDEIKIGLSIAFYDKDKLIYGKIDRINSKSIAIVLTKNNKRILVPRWMVLYRKKF